MRKYRSEEELDRFDFQDLMEEKIQLLKMPEDLLTRSVNVGFSGRGEEAQRHSADGGAGAGAVHP
ncbi:Probable ATP-dependent transporter SufC [Leclercia adecarboxylata]|uniref:Probable ATP-dependent transporter SufC n=1 Tax=Leclercia adecarboxylata TaxID=83655 RepID=A0A4U9HSC2_9ENTR|nr:Probable ATP-dependent transporter SufC [Leclercia adecarboxylata]